MKKTLTEWLSELPRGSALTIALLLCGIASYYFSIVLIVALGASASSLINPIALGMCVVILAFLNLLGLWMKRILLVGIVAAILFTGYFVTVILNGTGPIFPWIRQLIPYILMPLLSAILFSRIWGQVLTERKTA